MNDAENREPAEPDRSFAGRASDAKRRLRAALDALPLPMSYRTVQRWDYRERLLEAYAERTSPEELALRRGER